MQKIIFINIVVLVIIIPPNSPYMPKRIHQHPGVREDEVYRRRAKTCDYVLLPDETAFWWLMTFPTLYDVTKFPDSRPQGYGNRKWETLYIMIVQQGQAPFDSKMLSFLLYLYACWYILLPIILVSYHWRAEHNPKRSRKTNRIKEA